MVVVGGSKYYGHYKMTPPPQQQNTRCYLASPVCTFEWFIHILFPCLKYKNFVVGEGGRGGGGVGGGVKILWPL